MATAQSIDLSQLSYGQKLKMVRLLEARTDRAAQRLYYALYPDVDTPWAGPSIQKGLIQPGQILHARSKYPKHIEFFSAGAKYPERCAMCANRVGKTLAMGGFEVAAHLTGEYPDWWPGRRFLRPISVWAAGKNYETTRDIMQLSLLGSVKHFEGRKIIDGRGVIPGDRIGWVTWKSGLPDLVDTVLIKHKSGGWSDLGFKAYEQGRGSFEGTGKHVIWLDEEPPMAVYGECLIRTATTHGIIFITFTPLEGMSEVVLSFMPADQRPDPTQ